MQKRFSVKLTNQCSCNIKEENILVKHLQTVLSCQHTTQKTTTSLNWLLPGAIFCANRNPETIASPIHTIVDPGAFT